ncbi:uncharacterized protein LOC110455499 isoform X2 [Mizuhopecten yessoensis]|uniref:Pre-mRNA cleavage complex 2 protein Pcf11 n=1 Tax=Mizuhopecten yessoensis TaxID=6573 RepID=A0A210QCW3_MIZYE|nr:uncharacterized protein LOC110455499 isoform X2 [Mizuhopecten yessoensis]OWF46603.1 Pre-mRNA cleavage complex 2 protein Pcf11 [Mizuhopecten yessoensis]
MENEVINDYQSSLVDLTCNSKPLINMLTMLAEENEQYATHIVEVIETHINQASEKKKLPSLYLIDSIVKNLPKTTYPSLFSHNIVSVFCGMFEKVDEKTRQCMFKVRQTWNEIFPNRKLYAVDVRVNLVDPAWPVTAQPPVESSIHVNPKFLAAKQQKEEEEILEDDDLIIHDTVTEEQEALMRQQLIAKQQELLKLQQQRLELELKETKAKLDQQKQLNAGKSKHLEAADTMDPVDNLNPPIHPTPKSTLETTKPLGTSAPSRPTTRDPRLASRDPRSAGRDPRLKGKGVADSKTSEVSQSDSTPAVVQNSEVVSVPTSIVPTSLMAYPPPPLPSMMAPAGMMPPGMIPGYMPPVMNMPPQTNLGRPIVLPGMLPFPMPTAQMGMSIPPPPVVNINNQAIPNKDTQVAKFGHQKSNHDKSNGKVSKSSSSQQASQKSSTDHKSKDVKESSRSSRDIRADRKHNDKRDTSSSTKSSRHSDSKRLSVEKDRDQKDKDNKDRKSSSSRRESPRTSYSSASSSKEEKSKTRSDSKSESKSKKSDKDDTRHKRSSRDSDEDSRKSNRSDDSDDRRRENTRSTRSSKARTRSRSPVKSKSPEERKSKTKPKEKTEKSEKTEKKSTKEESKSKKSSPVKNSKKTVKEEKGKMALETEKCENVIVKQEPVELNTDDNVLSNEEKAVEIKTEKVDEMAVEPPEQDMPKVAPVEDMDVDDRQVHPQAQESLKREHSRKIEESDVTEEGQSSSKKPRLEEEPDQSTAKVMDEDISSLFGSEDQDYRSQRDGPGPPMKSPFHDKWMKFRENHPGDFKYELDLEKEREIAAHDVDHRRASSESESVKDVDHRYKGVPQDIDLRSSFTHKSLDQDARDYDSRNSAKPVHIPAALQLDHREEILEQIEHRRRSGELSHDMHQELLHQLSKLDNVQRQQNRLNHPNDRRGPDSPVLDTDRRGRDTWQYRSPLKDPPQGRSYDRRPDIQRTHGNREGPLKDFDDRYGPEPDLERRRTPPLDHSGPLRDRNNRDIDSRHGRDHGFDDRRRPPHNMDGPNRDFDNRLGPPRDYDRRREAPMDTNRPPRDWQGPDDRLRAGPGRDHKRDWNYNENKGRGWHNPNHWKDDPAFREDGPPGRYNDRPPRYNPDERGPPDGPHSMNGPYNDRGPQMGPPRQQPFIKQQQSSDPRWKRIVGYKGPEENEEFVIDGRPYGIAVGQPARKIRVAGRTIEVFADPNERAIRVDGVIVYRFGDMVRDVKLGRLNHKIFYHGLPRFIWIDGIMRELRVDAPPKILSIKDKEHTMRIDGRDLMILVDNKEMGVVGGPPRYVFIDNNRCEFRFDPPPRKILIDGTMSELKLDRAIPCVVINNKKRGIRFDGPPREIIVDNINYVVPVDDCVKIRINNRPHYLAFGGPAHEVILDGKWFEVKFGGPAKEISLGNRVIHVRLEGPPPEVKILNEIIEEPESAPTRYGPPKAVQDLRPDGLPQHLQPSGPGQQGPPALMMGGPMDQQPMMQGMMPPGQMMMNSIQSQPVMSQPGQPTYSGMMPPQNPMLPTQMPGMMPAVSGAMTNVFPGQAPVQAPNPLMNVSSLLQRLMATGIIPPKDTEKNDNTETTETPKPPEIKTSKNDNTKTGSINEKDFIKPVFKQVKIKDVPDLTELKTEKLKQLHEGVIQSLFSGIQCSACGQRFSAQQTERYREHLDWHFRQNRRDKDDAKVTKYRRWYYDVSDWITYEEIDESEGKGRSSIFEKMLAIATTANLANVPQDTVVNAPEGSNIIHCPPATGEDKGDVCEICGDPFEQFWNEDQEEWHLRDAIRVESKTYHPICYEDEKEGSILEPTPTPVKAPTENPLVKQIKEESNPIILQIRQELGELPVSAIDMSKVKVNKTKLFIPEDDDEEEPAPAAEIESVKTRDSEEESVPERDSVMEIIKSVVKTEPPSDVDTSVKTESGL